MWIAAPGRAWSCHALGVKDRWPLVGREAVLDHVAKVLGQPERAGVVLVGPAGVGKTRLALECRDIGERTGFATAVVMASHAHEGVPFGALARILPPIDQAAERGVAMLQQAREALEEMAGDRPLLLVVDDAHHLDGSSALLLHQLVQAQAAFVLMTVRSGETVSDPVVGLWKDGLAERIEVGPLDRAASDDLVAAALGGAVEGATLQAIWNASEGNPLFLREVVLSALESRALERHDELWRFVGSIEPSTRLVDLVERRISSLADHELSALELVAFGEPLGVELVGRLVGGSEPLESLEQKGLVVTERDGFRIQARLAHPLHGEALRVRTPPERARAARRSLARAVEATGARRRGDVLRIAVWRLEADDDDRPERFAEAAQQAAFANDFVMARRLAERAFASAPSFRAALVLADVLYEVGEVERTEAVLADVGDLADDDEQRGLYAILRASNLYWRLGRVEHAHTVLDEAMASIEDVGWRHELEATHALFETCARRPLDALARVEPILASGVTGRELVQAALAAVLGLPLVGRGHDAVALARRARGTDIGQGEQLRLYERSLMLEIGESLALSQLGDRDAAAAVARRLSAQSLEDAETAGWTFSALALGVALLEQGRPAEAGRWWKESAALFRAVQHHGPLRWALSGQLLCQALLGDLDGAAETMAELDEVGPHPAAMHELEVLRGRAWVLAASGDAGGARSLLDEGIDLAAGAGLDWEELVMRHEQVRMGADASDAQPRIEALGARVQGALGPLRAAHVAGLVARDPDALAEAAEGFERCGALLHAAEAAGAAAAEFRAVGRTRQAAACERAAARCAEECAGVRTPGVGDGAAPVALSRREREVALLAVDGASSREIAERLFLSQRTVENHLSRIYDKLGISGREELDDAMA